MGYRIELTPLGGSPVELEAISYTVNEQASPLAGGDTSGSVGSLSFTLPAPQPANSATDTPGRYLLNSIGPALFVGATVNIYDSDKGFIVGSVSDWSRSKDAGTITFSGVLALGVLNAYGVQAQPFAGTLENLFKYYLSLAGVTTNIDVDNTIANTAVVVPGWHGELWFHLKQMTIAYDCEIALVGDQFTLRPIRSVTATTALDTSRSTSASVQALAHGVEVYQYNNETITNQIVYPPGGWHPEVQVLNVNAGETTEYTLELQASLSSFQPPVMQTFVARDYDASSVYTVVADDGLPVSPAAWANFGGSVSVELNPDTVSLTVRLRGAVGLPTAAGRASASFSLALGSDVTGSRYSTLRIVGTGVKFNKTVHVIRTCVPANSTGTEIGTTIDNPFISTVNQRWNVGVRAARLFAAPAPSLSGSMVRISDTGNVQQFGNVQGARVWDEDTKRWYRVREGTLSPGSVGVSSAEDDVIMADLQAEFDGLTYNQVQTIRGGVSYLVDELRGIR